MPLLDQVCLECGLVEEYRYSPDELRPCSACSGEVDRLWIKFGTVIADDIPGGKWIENLGDKPQLVYSHTERKRLMKEAGLQEAVQHVGVQGSDKSPHTTRWY